MSTALSLLTRQAEKTPKVTSLSPRGLWHRIEEPRPTSITLKTRPSMFSKGSLRSSAPMNLSAPNPGTFVLLPKGLPHRFQNVSAKPGRLLCVQSPSGVEQFFEHMSALNEEGLPDQERLHQLTAKYGIEFLSDEK